MRVSSVASFAVGVQMLRTNPLRTVLSTLGIIIGVASLVAILALGDGIEQFSRRQIVETTDFQTVMIQPRLVESIDGVLIRRDSVPSFSPADAARLTETLGGTANASLTLVGSDFMRVSDDTVRRAALVIATTPVRPPVAGDSLIVAGRLPADGSDEAVVSERLADDLGVPPADLLTRRIAIAGHEYRVAGVMRAPAADRATRIWIPLDDEVAGRLSDGGRRAPSMRVDVHRIEDVPAVEARAREWITSRFRNADDFTIATSRQRVEQLRRAMLVFKLTLGAITGISILVGGIGIMNVLLASVHERTREIGVRRAAGARRADIFLQFIAESIAVSSVGSILGGLLGLAGAFATTAIIRRIAEAPVYAAFSPSTIVAAGLAAIFVGIAFGSYPAAHAARLSPMDAIRHE